MDPDPTGAGALALDRLMHGRRALAAASDDGAARTCTCATEASDMGVLCGLAARFLMLAVAMFLRWMMGVRTAAYT